MNTSFAQISFINAIENTTSSDGQALRLRERFLMNKSLEGYDDTEILTLLLTVAGCRGAIRTIAGNLLNEFGSMKNILEAKPDQLTRIKGIGKQAATLISLIVPMTQVWIRTTTETPNHIGNCREASNYCKSQLIGERHERFLVICLNAQCNLIGQKVISEGSLSEVSAYPRKVVEAALTQNAHSVLLCHNHPGGTCAPSREDIESTLQLQKLLAGLGIIVLDHIIVAGSDTYSMIQHGDIDYRAK